MLSRSNQTYNYHSSWNWSTKSFVFTKLTGSISSTLSFPHNCVVCLFISVFEDFNWRLSQFPQFNFFSLFVFILCYTVFTLSVLCVCLSFHHDDYAVALLSLYMSTYSASSSSSLRNFLTLKFLSEEFVKIAYSPPLVDVTHFQLVSDQGTPLFCVIMV